MALSPTPGAQTSLPPRLLSTALCWLLACGRPQGPGCCSLPGPARGNLQPWATNHYPAAGGAGKSETEQPWLFFRCCILRQICENRPQLCWGTSASPRPSLGLAGSEHLPPLHPWRLTEMFTKVLFFFFKVSLSIVDSKINQQSI